MYFWIIGVEILEEYSSVQCIEWQSWPGGTSPARVSCSIFSLYQSGAERTGRHLVQGGPARPGHQRGPWPGHPAGLYLSWLETVRQARAQSSETRFSLRKLLFLIQLWWLRCMGDDDSDSVVTQDKCQTGRDQWWASVQWPVSIMVRETRHLWVGNLPDNVSKERIKEYFNR